MFFHPFLPALSSCSTKGLIKLRTVNRCARNEETRVQKLFSQTIIPPLSSSGHLHFSWVAHLLCDPPVFRSVPSGALTPEPNSRISNSCIYCYLCWILRSCSSRARFLSLFIVSLYIPGSYWGDTATIIDHSVPEGWRTHKHLRLRAKQ